MPELFILNMSDTVHSIQYIEVTVQFVEQLPRQTYLEHCKTFEMKRFAKRITCNQKYFRAGGIVELGHFDKHFVKNTRKRGPVRKDFVVFFLDTFKTTSLLK